MISARIRSAIRAVTNLPERWRKAAAGAAILVVSEVGARIALPGLNGQVLRDFLRHDAGGALRQAYDFVLGGAMSRGTVLGIGIMPYLSARLMISLARLSSPTIRARLDANDRLRSRVTRALTTTLALVQSYGFARFTQGIPGAVSLPGAAYVGTTMLLLTSGSVLLMLLTERILSPGSREIEDEVVNGETHAGAGTATSPQLTAGNPLAAELLRADRAAVKSRIMSD